MKSKTSFFNLTLLRKNIIRFSPLWIIYTIIWVMVLPVTLAVGLNNPYGITGTMEVKDTILRVAGGGTIAVALVASVVMAMAVWSYLYSSRSVSLMHALPIRRSGLYATNFVSGYLFMLVPNVIAALLTLLVTSAAGVACPGAILTWFLVICGEELFFFALASVLAMLTGQLLALPIFYFIWNFIFIIMGSMLDVFAQPMRYGYSMHIPQGLTYLSPATAMAREIGVETQWVSGGYAIESVFLRGTAIVGVYALVGVVLAILGYVAYRVRHSESAGDTVTFRWAKVLFRFGIGFCTAYTLGFGLYTLLFANAAGVVYVWEFICLLLLGLVGYYVAQMLLKKSFRVFRKDWVGGVITACLVSAVFFGACFDAAGFERRIPAAENVSSVALSLSAEDYMSGVVESPESINEVLALHQRIVDDKANQRALETADYDGSVFYDADMYYVYTQVNIDYTLKSGYTMSRSYSLRLKPEDVQNPDTVAGAVAEMTANEEYWRSHLLGGVKEASVTGGAFTYYDAAQNMQELNLTETQAKALVKAIYADAHAGRMGNVSLFSYDYENTRYVNTISFDYIGDDGRIMHYYSVNLYPEMTDTIAVLKEQNILSDSIRLMRQDETFVSVDGDDGLEFAGGEQVSDKTAEEATENEPLYDGVPVETATDTELEPVTAQMLH